MEWTKEQPNKPGYYWFFNADIVATPEMVIVTSVAFPIGHPMVFKKVGDFGLRKLDELVENYLWFGPIKPPEIP